ncbi:hypothetical protein GWC95_17045 [Sediminibacterium roseum]|uniref:Uncharacterized protein n=2 Tax=Sediminibacterium roseum TaxID=1978412 RepID=A0ABW9ZX76_9BACT|nr:hypothetical protein [Sediminibacterium roseum]
MIERYQAKMYDILKPEVKAMNPNVLTISETFNKEAILEYFSRPDIKYIRIYQGMSVNGEFHSILVGADDKGVDIFPTGYGHGHGDGHGHGGHGGGHGHPGNPPGDDPDPLVFEDGVRCPTTCPPPGGPLTNFPRH